MHCTTAVCMKIKLYKFSRVEEALNSLNISSRKDIAILSFPELKHSNKLILEGLVQLITMILGSVI